MYREREHSFVKAIDREGRKRSQRCASTQKRLLPFGRRKNDNVTTTATAEREAKSAFQQSLV